MRVEIGRCPNSRCFCSRRASSVMG
jgi:hypothetical protein